MDRIKEGRVGYTLTQRMASVVQELKDQYTDLISTMDFRMKLRRLQVCAPDEAATVRMELTNLFHKCGIESAKYNQPVQYYEKLLQEVSVPTPQELTHQVYQSFLGEFSKNPYPLPEDYIARQVKDKIDPAWRDDTLRLQILKKFIRDADGLRAAGYSMSGIKTYLQEKTGKKPLTEQNVPDALDDGVFDLLNGAAPRLVRKNGKYGLIKVANDLAGGKFGNANVVREEIYLFAAVFGLTYSTDDPEEIIVPENRGHNIERVMFCDYYTNNVMRYVSDQHWHIRDGGEEPNPVGRGINYKNYMEAIYLYYLQRTDLTPAEKLSRVYAMAQKVHTEFKEDGRHKAIPQDKATLQYREDFKHHTLETEEEFAAFLIGNYDCSVPPEGTRIFEVEAEQNTAAKVYQELLQDAESYGVSAADRRNRGLVFLMEEVDTQRIEEFRERLRAGECRIEDLDDKTRFDLLLYEVDRDLLKQMGPNALKDQIVSRADILRLFYQLYINLCGQDDDRRIWRSFQDVYDDFTDQVNLYLKEALLMPVNGRNLYDLILIYSAYCAVNESALEEL